MMPPTAPPETPPPDDELLSVWLESTKLDGLASVDSGVVVATGLIPFWDMLALLLLTEDAVLALLELLDVGSAFFVEDLDCVFAALVVLVLVAEVEVEVGVFLAAPVFDAFAC